MTMPDMTMDEHGDKKPVPDPTALTTEQLNREISRLDEIVKLRSEAGRAELEGQISLTRERFEALRRSLDERYATQQFAIEIAQRAAIEVKGDTKTLFDSKIEALRVLLDERYQTQTKALDAAFVAQQAVVSASFDASEKAIEKANVAAEKRFDALNEALAQVNSATTSLLPRAEAEVRFVALNEKVAGMQSAIDRGFTGVDTRQAGTDDNRDASQGRQALLVASIGLMLTFIFIMVSLFAVFHH